jgi:hypothetical protein
MIWLTYAAVEHGFAFLGPLVLSRDATPEPWFRYSRLLSTANARVRDLGEAVQWVLQADQTLPRTG